MPYIRVSHREMRVSEPLRPDRVRPRIAAWRYAVSFAAALSACTTGGGGGGGAHRAGITAAGRPVAGFTFDEQQAITEAELDQLADTLIDALASSSGEDGPGANAVYDRLRATPVLRSDDERFPSRITKTVWSCRRPVDDDLRAALARFCRRPDDRYAEVYAAGFSMWRTLDALRCPACFDRFAVRRDRFLLGALAAKLARAGYVGRGPGGLQRFTLGLPTPIGHVFARSDRGPVVLVSSGGIDPQTGGSAADSVVLTFFLYLPVIGT